MNSDKLIRVIIEDLSNKKKEYGKIFEQTFIWVIINRPWHIRQKDIKLINKNKQYNIRYSKDNEFE